MGKGSVTIIGMGPGPVEMVTPAALKAAAESGIIFIRTMKHKAAEAFTGLGRAWEAFDSLYDGAASFEEAYGKMSDRLFEAASSGSEVAFVVPGSPASGEVAARLVAARCAESGIPVHFVHGLGFVDACCMAAGVDALVDGIIVIGAFRLDEQWPASSSGKRMPFAVPVLIGEVYDRMMAGTVKMAVAEAYGDEHPILVIDAAGDPELSRVRRMKAYELDRSDDFGPLTSVLVAKPAEPESARPASWPADRIVDIMARLRGEGGCPWDRKQTLASLRPYVLEEAYEVAGAIDEGDMAHLCEELGDLLLQVVFQARLAQEEGHFDFSDVVDSISEKLIRRHPHIFSDVEADTPEKVLRNWEYIKQQEKAEKAEGGDEDGPPSILSGIATALPALWYSSKMQDKAARVGFDWKTAQQAMAKVREEVEEVEEALVQYPEKLEEEIGDLIFAVVNVARLSKVDSEAALKKTADKFRRRFMYIEARALEMGEKLEDMGLDRLDGLWNEAKAQGF
ncbi:MAG TPA: nucleoside triphosphate pyrophosphohydrolase [Bacillota bacterium]|nr:nucleoside triphosphate pyrophosphohydrolase [Bacillota bacterium]HOA15712.1 nucleoside triphosphate pyrophosphohydrolase [Bacillota bacterium]HOG52594.1 nucleoside triphosphate pyrophosphohydrolase [Bacillota bacterium]